MQKIWLGVFLAMFLVPEILWSPVGNFVYELFSDSANVKPFRDNFLYQTMDNANYLSSILFIQLLGIFLTFIYLIVVRKSIQNKIIFWLSLGVALLLSVITFFCFGLSISLRNIGF